MESERIASTQESAPPKAATDDTLAVPIDRTDLRDMLALQDLQPPPAP